MTEYTNVPQANALYLENEQVTSAITAIDAGGQMNMFSIAPPPPESGQMMMTVAITVPPPVDATLMADLRQWLVDRSAAIEAELAALGVTDQPPAPPPTMPASPQKN